MKKFFIMLMLLLTVSSTIFAKADTDVSDNDVNEFLKNYVDSLSGCRLDLKRWADAGVSQGYSYLRFFDTKTIVPKSRDLFEVWICDYLTGKKTCGLTACENAKIDASKHYHYSRVRFNGSDLTYTRLSTMIKDPKNEKTIDSYTVPSFMQTAKPIPPESMVESVFITVKQYLQESKKQQ